MMRSSRLLFWLIAIPTLLYALVFPLLTVDSLALLFDRSDAYEPRNFLLILYLELSRLFATLTGTGVAVYLLTRASNRREGRALALFLLFATITYEKVFGGGVFPGPVQEGVTLALIGAGISSDLLRWLFAPQIWTAWPALAALLRFSAVYPSELHEDALVASGHADRQGFMRGSGVAGADVGELFRRMSAWLLAKRAFDVAILTAFAVGMVVIHMLVSRDIHALVFWAFALLLLFVAITNIRSGYMASGAEDRARAAWITLGVILGLFIFIISSAAYILIATTVVRALAFGLMMLVPAVVMTCLAVSVLSAGRHDARVTVHGTVRAGAIVIVMILVVAAVYAGARELAELVGMSGSLALLLAVVVAALAYAPVSRATDRARQRILEDG